MNQQCAPKQVDEHPADSGSDSDCFQLVRSNKNPGENYTQGNMADGSNERKGNLSNSIVISCEGVSGKAEYIEDSNDLQVRDGVLKGFARMLAKHKSGCKRSRQKHESAAGKTNSAQKFQTAEEGVANAVLLSSTVVLGGEDGGGCGSAVTEGICESFYACGSCVGGDQVSSTCIDSALNQHFSNVQTGLVQGSDRTKAQGFLNLFRCELAILFLKQQFTMAVKQIEDAGTAGKNLSDGGGDGSTGNTQRTSGYKNKIQNQVGADGDA